jgi:ureidoglycolate hydrolase
MRRITTEPLTAEAFAPFGEVLESPAAPGRAYMDKMLETMKSMQNTLTDINATLSEAKGGWKVLMLVGGAAGTVGAGIVQVVHWWSK